MIEEEDVTILWQKKLVEVSVILRDVYDKVSFNHEDLSAVLLLTLYVFYDLEQDFMPQFIANCEKALETVRKLESAKGEFTDG